jgi:hypothetical protein
MPEPEDELLAVIFQLKIVRFPIIETPEDPRPVPIPHPKDVPIARRFPPSTVSRPSRETPPDSPQPTPRPTPPRTSKEPFKNITEPHKPFTEDPIPAEVPPPTANSEPSKSACSVTFESNEQSKPTEPRPNEEKTEESLKTKRTVLLEIVTAEVVLRKVFATTITTFADETRRK